MLLVVFGAGASYDSVLQLPPPPPDWIAATNTQKVHKFGAYEEFRLPLANQLFDDRPLFVNSMQKFSDFMPLVNLLRGNVQIEQKLAKFEAEAEKFPPRHRQLTAIRYYLHEVLWKCQKKWSEQHGGITNYSTFLDAIERWRHENDEQVCYVTFNYDTMLEESIEARWHIAFNDFSSYIRQPYFKLIKLHGSIDWGLEFNTYPANRSIDINEVIEGSPRGLNLSGRYQKVRHTPVTFDDGRIGFPALAIPVEKKREFNCPSEPFTL